MVAAVGKVAVLLRAFPPSVDVLSVRQLAARTGLPRSTVHAIATTLARDGLLAAVAGRGYRLGPLIVGLAGQIIERTGLVAAVEAVAPPRRIAGQELHVGQLVDGWVVYLHRESGPVRTPMDNRVGLRAPAWRGGCGKAALAGLDPADVEDRVARLCRAEDLPQPDVAALHAELERARRDGWLVSSSFQEGRTSVAAPVGRPGAPPVGGLSVAGPSELFGRATVARLGPEVAAAAARAGASLR